MKKLLFLIFVFIGTLTFGQDSQASGDWTEDALLGSTSFSGTKNIVDGHVVISSVNISLWLGGELNIISGSLTIDAELLSVFGSNINVYSGAELIINGDLTSAFAGTLVNEGDLTVTGTIINSGSSIITNTGIITADEIINNGYIDNTGGIIDANVSGSGDLIGNSPLPIELLHFYGDYDYNKTTLYWATASETNNDYFVIYYSLDAVNWDELGTVTGAGNSSTTINYNYNHYTKKSYYYKLKQVDYDGVNETFNLIFVQSVYVNMDRTYDVYDTNGRLIRKGKTSDIQDLKTGIYLLKYNQETHKIYID